MIINRSEAEVDNHIPEGDSFDHHPLRNAVFILFYSTTTFSNVWWKTSSIADMGWFEYTDMPRNHKKRKKKKKKLDIKINILFCNKVVPSFSLPPDKCQQKY